MGMRYTEYDEAIPRAAAIKAVGPARGGVKTSNSDNAVLVYSSNFTKGLSGTLSGSERANYYIGEPLLNFLKNNGVDEGNAGGFIHRLVYPLREYSVNAVNVKEAATRMGDDKLGVRVFWDKL